MSNAKGRLLAGTILSTLAIGSVHAAPLDGLMVVAQAPQGDHEKEKKPQGDHEKEKRPERPNQPSPQPQQRQVQPSSPPPQQREVQPPPRQREVQPPPREVQPPPRQREVQPPQREVQPPPRQREIQPPQREVQPPPKQRVQPPPAPPQQREVQPPPAPPQQRQVQPPPPQQREVQPPLPPSPQRQVQPPPVQQQVQPPSQGAQPLGVPQPTPGAQQQGQRGAGGPTGQPPRPISPQQPLGQPAIAPGALQPPTPAPGSPAAQVQRAFVPPPAQDNARRLDDVRGARREVREGNRVLIEEPGRVIVEEGGRTIIRHNDADRFRWQAQDVRIERRGADTVTVFERPDGSRIYSENDESGRLLRRYRRLPDGREIIIIDNRYSGPPMPFGYFVDLPPPLIRIPRERYIVDAEYAQPDDIYDALWAAPVDYIQRPYTLDEVRYSFPLRARMPSVDLNTVTFETGSWEVSPDQIDRLAVIADGMNRAIAANPSEVFLIEGHTDAVGSQIDNLSLSDRRAESVALVLSQQFGVPAENLTTQGYGNQYLKVPTQGPERANRRVTVRRITPLLTGQNQAIPLAPR
jgi:outer membrane protein OmpA-like peptidoglycan-associated protein